MPHRPTGQDYTVLDFINRPNPVEPTAAPSKHPLHSSAQLNSGYTNDLRRLLLESGPCESSGEPSAKRRKTADDCAGSSGDKARDLPKLPTRPGSNVRVRRARLPPTLSGLHQPPPNAGLLPSISVQQPSDSGPAADSASTICEVTGCATEVNTCRPAQSQPNAKPGKPRRNKWSDEETACLLKGVARFGIGSWTKILRCDEYQFERRTALDLKDRFRVCCPDHYKKPKPPQSTNGLKARNALPAEQSCPKSRGSARKGTAELASLGIEEPFQRSTRRMRSDWTIEEDNALWDGFSKHGKSWTSIQHDEHLELSHRTPTDLRDRLRQRYPNAYAKTGLRPRPENFPAPPDRGHKGASEVAGSSSEHHTKRSGAAEHMPSDPRQSHKSGDRGAMNKPHPAPPMFLPNDVFFGMPGEDDEFDPEPIVLDRGILDWALDSSRPNQQDMLNHSSEPGSNSRQLLPSAPVPSTTVGNNSAGTLPSVAAITAANDDYTDLELPSLMQYLDDDGRGGGHSFLSLEDLLQTQVS